jgi:hypothetical protein
MWEQPWLTAVLLVPDRISDPVVERQFDPACG